MCLAGHSGPVGADHLHLEGGVGPLVVGQQLANDALGLLDVLVGHLYRGVLPDEVLGGVARHRLVGLVGEGEPAPFVESEHEVVDRFDDGLVPREFLLARRRGGFGVRWRGRPVLERAADRRADVVGALEDGIREILGHARPDGLVCECLVGVRTSEEDHRERRRSLPDRPAEVDPVSIRQFGGRHHAVGIGQAVERSRDTVGSLDRPITVRYPRCDALVDPDGKDHPTRLHVR